MRVVLKKLQKYIMWKYIGFKHQRENKQNGDKKKYGNELFNICFKFVCISDYHSDKIIKDVFFKTRGRFITAGLTYSVQCCKKNHSRENKQNGDKKKYGNELFNICFKFVCISVNLSVLS
jgi:hypothetical protein